MAEEQKVVTSNEEVKAPEQKERAPRARGDRKPNGKGPRKFNKNGPRREEKIYEERVVAINRVSKTVKGGRHMRFAVLRLKYYIQYMNLRIMQKYKFLNIRYT